MKIGYLINSLKYKKHKEWLELLESCGKQYGESVVVNMGDNKPLHEVYYSIKDARADLWITLDGAGFELRTENDTLSLNNIYAKMAHVLLKPMKEYQNILRNQLNFSMFMYVVNKQDMEVIKKSYPNIPNIGLFPKIEQETETNKRQQLLRTWFEDVLWEVELQNGDRRELLKIGEREKHESMQSM